MALLRATKLSKSFGTNVVFSDVTFEILPKDHVGLVGVNGCGKTTLLRILGRGEAYDDGQLAVGKGVRIAMLEQAPVWPQGQTLYEATLEASAPLIAMEEELQRLSMRMEQAGADVERSMLLRQAALTEQYQQQGGLTFRSRTRSTLLGLGFSEFELDQPIERMSGGQMRKAELARVLMTNAELLLLDEPTNHLDIRSLEWLEDYLSGFSGAYIVISHDRYFLDHVCTRVFELENRALRITNGNYTQHVERKLDERAFAERRYQNDLREIKRIEGVIEQQRRWNQARNYVTIASKQKQIERLKKQLVKPTEAPDAIHFRLEADELTCNDVIVCRHLSKRFGEKTLFTDLNLLVHNGEKVCIIGENGCGKTTLFRILLNQIEPDDGSYLLGNHVNVGYFEQSTVHTQSTATLLEHLQDAFPRYDAGQLRNLLGTFLFRGDDVFKRLDTLSGGEMARIQLLKMMLRGNNVLLLDEPTNHLDIPSCEALENTLAEYGGTMLIITHDRYLANRIADRILLLSTNGIQEFAGDWDAYKAFLSEADAVEQPQQEPAAEPNAYLHAKAHRAAVNRAKGELDRAERSVAECEREIAALEQRLAAPETATDYEAAAALYEEIARHRQALDEAYAAWEEAEQTHARLVQEEA